MIKGAIATGRMSLPSDPVIEDALRMLEDFLDGLYYIFTVLSDEGRKNLDNYCTGMIFGLQGSKMLVKIANTLINPLDKDGNPIPLGLSKEERAARMGGSGPNIVEGARDFMDNLGQAFARSFAKAGDL